MRLANHRGKSNRDGATTVEFALVAPVVLLLFFALVELMIFNTAVHAMNHAAYEAARSGMLPGATKADCEEKAKSLIGRIGYENLKVEVSPDDLSEATEVTVKVSLAASDVGLATSFVVKHNELSQSVTLKTANLDFD